MKKLKNVILLLIICKIHTIFGQINDQLFLYPEPSKEQMEENTDFRVWVSTVSDTTTWYKLFVYKVRVDADRQQEASMVQFDMGETVEVLVVPVNGLGETAAIRPLSKHIPYTIVGDSALKFTLFKPAKLSIELNGDNKHNLHLFANMPETETYDGTEPNCINWNSRSKDIYRKNARLIYFGPGIHRPKDLPSSEIRIPSNTTVYLAPGAIVKARLVVAKADNVRILGRGILDHPLRGVEITYSTNILIEGITIVNPDHYSIFCGESKNITIKNIKAFSSKGWSDGIDVMSSKKIVIDDVFLRNSDDCIAIYAHRWNYWGDTKEISVKNSVLWADVAHPINIGVHGDDLGKGDIIEKIRFDNIDILEHDEDDDPYRGCMSIACGDNNRVRNINFENIRIEDFEEGRLFSLTINFNEKYNNAPGKSIEDISFRNISYNGKNAFPSVIKGYDEQHPIKGVTFEQITINGQRMKDTKEFYTNNFIQNIIVK